MRVFGLMVALMCGAACGQFAPAPAQPERKASDPSAAKLVNQAAALLRVANTDEAQKALDEAKALNDQEVRLWSTYGYLQVAKGDKAAAVLDFQKEIALHPEVTEVYVTLADLQSALGRRADEEDTLGKLLKVEARIPGAAARLVTMLVEDGKAAEAVKVGQDASTRFDAAVAISGRLNPRAGDELQFALSKAQLAAGKKTESQATLVALMKITSSAQLMNDGAFRLADEGAELPLAEKSVRAALLQVELNSRRLTLGDRPEIQKAVVDQVAAVWDTLAWVLFREGRLDDAEGYARSAWLQHQGAAVGDHLAEIEAARGDKNLALTVCELSVAAPPLPPSARAGAEAPSVEAQAAANAKAAEDARSEASDQAKLKATADSLRKAGAVARGPAVLHEMLTAPMAPVRGVSGSGEFRVLLGFGIVETADAADKTNPPGMLSGILGARVGVKLWPKDSGARLVMKATITCKPAGCLLVLANLD